VEGCHEPDVGGVGIFSTNLLILHERHGVKKEYLFLFFNLVLALLDRKGLEQGCIVVTVSFCSPFESLKRLKFVSMRD
jgi:hypothetical protein